MISQFLKLKIIFPLIFIFSLITFFAHTYFTKTAIFADGKFYYAITRSIVKDADIRFENEYQELNVGIDHTKTGHVWNMYPPGISLFWIPGFILADGAVDTFNLVPGVNLNRAGYSLIYQSSVAISSILLGILGLFLVYLTLKKYFSKKTSILAVIALYAETNLLFYISVEQINSHAVSFFVSALFVYYFIIHEPNRSGSPTKYYFVLGILGGIAGLVRSQDALIIILPIIQVFKNLYETITNVSNNPLQLPPLQKGEGIIPLLLKEGLGVVISLMLGFIFGFLPQLFFWHKIFGTVGSPYTEVGFNFLSPHIIDILFNLENGLISITPIIAVMVIGIFLLRKEQPRIALYGMVYFFLQLYLISSWNSSIGGSYSNRMFISTYPLLAFGLADIIRFIKKKYTETRIILLITLFSLLNVVSIFRYLLLY